MSLFSSSAASLNVVILLLPQSSLMSLAATLDTMRVTNRISRGELFNWKIASIDGAPVKLSCGYQIQPDVSFNDELNGDLLICIAAFSHHKYMDQQNLLRFKKLATKFDYIGGVESGSWILARAGFLHNRHATTHWEDLEDFRNAYPAIHIRPDRYIIDGKYFTTGGAAPTIDLFMHLVKSRYGPTLALEVASVFIYNGDRHGQTPQPLVSLGIRQEEQPRMSAAVRLMEEYIDNPLSNQDIAHRLKISKRTLESLFRKQLATSPQIYYKRLRLQAAKRLVLDSDHNMQEIAIRCGFNSLAAFSREFKRFFKLSPIKYRKQVSDKQGGQSVLK